MNADEELKGLEEVRGATKKFILPEFMKPCVARILNNSFEKGGVESRNRIAYVIAIEFRRIGKERSVAEKILNQWNDKNDPPLNYSEIRGVIKSAWKKDYTFGCNKEPIVLDFCIGKETCGYYKQIQGDHNKGSDGDFFKYGWPKVLLPAQRCVYGLAIPEIEKVRGLKPGSLIYTSHREISKFSGIVLGRVGEILESLRDKHRLIEYKPGQPYRWRVQGSEIRRKMPIPRPPIKRNYEC